MDSVRDVQGNESAWNPGVSPGIPRDFRPRRLALHEIIIPVTAGIGVAEGIEKEVFGRNFRRIATRIRDACVLPRLGEIEQVHADLCAHAAAAALAAMAPGLRRPA